MMPLVFDLKVCSMARRTLNAWAFGRSFSLSTGRKQSSVFRYVYWSRVKTEILNSPKSILEESNEGTLTEVSSFVQDTVQREYVLFEELYSRANILNSHIIPTGFIVTGPNIASQSLLFQQLSQRLKEDINGPVITVRSGDATNLKAALKQLIRDATNQRSTSDDDDEGGLFEQHVSLSRFSTVRRWLVRGANSWITTWKYCMDLSRPTAPKE